MDGLPHRPKEILPFRVVSCPPFPISSVGGIL
jgi:hypothetical protein